MAEFCKDCAPKYDHYFEGYPCLCEGCGKHFEKKENCLVRIFRSFYLAMVVLWK